MAKKTKLYVVPGKIEENRDAGKEFKIEEMGAVQAEKWCYRFMSGLLKSGNGIPLSPEEANDMPAEELAIKTFGSILHMNHEYSEPLLDELLTCVSFARFKDNREKEGYRPLNKDVDIEEVSTLTNIRLEVYKLHLGFLKAVLAPIFADYEQKNKN